MLTVLATAAVVIAVVAIGAGGLVAFAGGCAFGWLTSWLFDRMRTP